MTSPLAKKVERVISPTAESMGYEIVRILMVGVGSGKPTLQVMAEKPDGTMLVDDCERLSQAISALLDVEGTIDETYYLEVSSPGIDRPLTRLKDFDRYKDNDARVEVAEAINGQKKFKGRLKGLDGEMILMTIETGEVSIPFSAVERAKLLLTDELIRKVTSQDNRTKKENRKLKKTGKK